MSEESVYNLIDHPVPPKPKPPIYISKYPPNIPPTASTFGLQNTSKPGVSNVGGNFEDPDSIGNHKIKKPYATMGKTTKGQFNETLTKNFLKKGSGTIKIPPAKKFTREITERKPPVPTRKEKPIMGLKSTTNFIVSNAVENILAAPKRPRPNQFNWTQKPEFGQVPKYLEKIKKEIEDEQAYIQELKRQKQEMEENKGMENLRLLSEEEKQELRNGLKARWQELHTKYQGLSFSTDRTNIIRKEKIEKEMDQLEKDIERLKKKYIFVLDE